MIIALSFFRRGTFTIIVTVVVIVIANVIASQCDLVNI